jgi:2-polyprenyl-3-methyl-5-hydroxy-6-metoxy-1,4-benzoquinol methylase
MTVTEQYQKDFFEMHVAWRDEYIFVADAIADCLSFKTVVDFGCGNGYLIARMAERGRDVMGIDGSEHAEEYCSGMSVVDLTKPVNLGRRRDLVICTEVAEHLDEKFADVLIDSISRAARRWVFFSAAFPGSGGYRHVNEQPKQYWLDKFTKHKLGLRQDKTDEIMKIMEPIKDIWWFKNAYVLAR